MPSGMAIRLASTKPVNTVLRLVNDLVEIGGLAGVVPPLDFFGLAFGFELGVALLLTLVEGVCLVPLADMVGGEHFDLLPNLRRPGNRTRGWSALVGASCAQANRNSRMARIGTPS